MNMTVFMHVIHNLANLSKKIPNSFNDPATAPHHPDGLLALSTAEQSVEMCKALGFFAAKAPWSMGKHSNIMVGS